jgi:hypothetical protein
MRALRILVLASFAVTGTMVTKCVAADPASRQAPNDPAAETILNKARHAVVAAARLKIECDWSAVDNPFEIETRVHQTLYVEKSIGYLTESQFVPVAGQVSRARTRSGRPYRLQSRALTNTRQLYRDRSLTYFDKLDKGKYEVVKDPETVKLCEPAAFVGSFVPPGLDYAVAWEDVRSRYRIEQGPSTPATVGIRLTLRDGQQLPGTSDRQVLNRRRMADFVLSNGRDGGPGFAQIEPVHRNEPEHHQVVLDRRSLLPVSWRRVCRDSDSLMTYTRVDLNPAAEDLSVPPTKSQEPLTRSDGQPEPADLEDYSVAIQATYCVLRLFHLL